MKRFIKYGRLLFVVGIVPCLFGQNQQEKILLSQSVNSGKLQSIIQRQENDKDFQRSEVEKLIRQGYAEFIEGDDGTFSQLIGTNEFGDPVYLQTMNQNVVNTLGANVLHSGFDSFLLTGEDMTIGLWEPKSPRLLHEILRVPNVNPFQSRVTYISGQISGVDRHATHVAGTLIGNQTNTGSSNQLQVRGVAYKSTIRAYDWNLAASEMANEADTNGLLVANTSFGYAPAPLNKVEYGRYSSTSQEWDAVMCGAPFLQIVKPAGNVRDDSPFIVPQVTAKGGFDLLESSGTSKNVLVVSAFDLAQDEPLEIPYEISEVEVPYSSWGPTDDGRIKPDITAHGHSVYSSIETSNSGYGLLSGTSMATAGVSGAIILLQQYYNNKFGDMYDPEEVPYLWSSTVRALIVHTADEAGDPGPDYKYGWGVMNAVSAAEIIEQRGKSTIIREETLEEHSEFGLNVVSNGYEPLVVTLAWTDPEGEVDEIDLENPVEDNTNHKLINDLDVYLVRLAGNGDETTDEYLLPWKRLEGITTDVNLLNAPATRGVNHVDNIEKIEIQVEDLPEFGGVYRIVVSHSGEELTDNCIGEGQNFSLIVSGVAFCGDTIELFQHQDDILTEYEEGLHLRADNITASNVIEPVLDPESDENLVEYEAASWIELVPQGNEGFTADFGSDFLAHIDCVSLTDQAFSSREKNSILKNERADESLNTNESIIMYPNPVINNFLNIQFELEESSDVKFVVYDLNGSIINGMNLSQKFEKGKHQKVLDLGKLPKGVFIVKVITSDKTHTQKIIKK